MPRLYQKILNLSALKKFLENIAGKAGNAGNQHHLFKSCFPPCHRKYLELTTYSFSSANESASW